MECKRRRYWRIWKEGEEYGLEWLCHLGAKLFGNSPLIVLGSGASIPYGLPSMKDLAEAIENDDVIKAEPEFENLCKTIAEHGLESAIDSVQLQQQTIERIRYLTWDTINKSDAEFFDKHHLTPPKEFVDLLNKVVAPTPNTAVIVTTNYDRLPEYAADGIDATSITGFEGSILRKLEIPTLEINQRRTRCRERAVNIWKVHGSLDWFIDNEDRVISIPMARNIPEGFTPLVVPPGKEKYSSTHKEPYRSIIAEADKAFVQAKSYLCIGYGFNDEHIQPKLLEQIATGKPIVILARTMTPACKQHIIDANIRKYLIFERLDEEHTRVYSNGWSETYEGQFWSLAEFLKIW